jgi:hypothetical protein
MDIKYFIDPIFKIEFFKIKSVNFKKKKKAIEKVLKQYPEIPFDNFYSNRNKSQIAFDLTNILHIKKVTTMFHIIMGPLVIVVFYI